jgi:hypothetical protein
MRKQPQEYKVDYSLVISTIPECSYMEPQGGKDNKVETRWRFLCIPPKEVSGKPKTVVEVSRKRPSSEREYLNKSMQWVKRSIDPFFDQFVVKQYHYYSDQ